MARRTRSVVPATLTLQDEVFSDSGQVGDCVSAIERALSLSPAQALAALGVWCGMSEDRVATWIGRSRATVHTHISAAYERLHAHGLPRGQVALVRAVERTLAKARVTRQDV